MSAFTLPSGVPLDTIPTKNNIPYLTVYDNSNYHVIPTGQYIKSDSNLWVPVSSVYPQPSKPIGSNSLQHGITTVTTAGEAVQLNSNLACREVLIIALRTNTGFIYIGGSTVSSSSYGAELEAKDSITLQVSNLNLIYIDSSVSSEGVSYIVLE